MSEKLFCAFDRIGHGSLLEKLWLEYNYLYRVVKLFLTQEVLWI
jgi:hypothetical protein